MYKREVGDVLVCLGARVLGCLRKNVLGCWSVGDSSDFTHWETSTRLYTNTLTRLSLFIIYK